MVCYIDLRYALPPLINLFFVLLLPNQEYYSNYGLDKIAQYPFLLFPLLFLAVVAFLFLFTSIRLGLNVEPVLLQAGDFSAPVALLLLASIIFPPAVFWFVYFILIMISPWHGILVNLFNYFLCWLRQTLQSLPTLIVACIPLGLQRQESVEVMEPTLAQVLVDQIHEADDDDVNIYSGTQLTYPNPMELSS